MKTDDTKATERFQDSQVRVTSRDTESGWIKPGCKTGKTQQQSADVEYAKIVERKQSNEEK